MVGEKIIKVLYKEKKKEEAKSDWEHGGWDRLWELLNWFPESLTHLAYN